MVDTQEVMTSSQLLTENYVSNANTGAIGSRNHRNLVKSVFGCYGGATTNLGSRIMTVGVASYVDIVGMALEQAKSDLTVGLGTDSTDLGGGIHAGQTSPSITIPSDACAGTYDVSFSVCLRRESATPASTQFDPYFIRLKKGALEVVTSCGSIATNTEVQVFSGRALVALVKDDVIKLDVGTLMSTSNLTLLYGNFSAKRIG